MSLGPAEKSYQGITLTVSTIDGRASASCFHKPFCRSRPTTLLATRCRLVCRATWSSDPELANERRYRSRLMSARPYSRGIATAACREEPLSPIVDSSAFAASLAQHLTIIFLIDNHGPNVEFGALRFNVHRRKRGGAQRRVAVHPTSGSRSRSLSSVIG
jgi:hypothetical protein